MQAIGRPLGERPERSDGVFPTLVYASGWRRPLWGGRGLPRRVGTARRWMNWSSVCLQG